MILSRTSGSQIGADVAAIVNALDARKVGAGWAARCPVHEDREPSLSIRDEDGTVLVYCHAGCKQRDVIGYLISRGLWVSPVRESRRAPFLKASLRRSDRNEQDRSAAARVLWNSTSPAAGSLVETYLASRGLKLPPQPALRFHPSIRHPAGERWPAMISLVTLGSDATPIAIHRTFLDRGGSGKAPVAPSKMMLGPCRGGVVRLAESTDLLMVGEGIETCLAAMQATGWPAWAALSTSGLRSLELPPDAQNIIVLADGDLAGEKAALKSARRWKEEGRRVRLARPPEGQDFNDLLLASLPAIKEAAQ